MALYENHRRRMRSSIAVVLLSLTGFILAGSCGLSFITSGTSPLHTIRPSVTVDENLELFTAPVDFPVEKKDTLFGGWGWAATLSILVAVGLMASPIAPANADSYSDPIDVQKLLTPPLKPTPLQMADAETYANEARAELLKTKGEAQQAVKEARLKERMAIRQIVEEKKKAEEIIGNNVKAELEKIKAEREAALTANAERQKEALAQSVAANKFAADSTEEKRLEQLRVKNDSAAPNKAALTKALADEQSAVEDATAKKTTASDAVEKLETAELVAAQKRAAVESAVAELARAGQTGALLKEPPRASS